MKLTNSTHKLKSLSPWAPEWVNERANGRNGGREQGKQCEARKWVSGASERANGGANCPVFYASISSPFYPMCTILASIGPCLTTKRQYRSLNRDPYPFIPSTQPNQWMAHLGLQIFRSPWIIIILYLAVIRLLSMGVFEIPKFCIGSLRNYFFLSTLYFLKT